METALGQLGNYMATKYQYKFLNTNMGLSENRVYSQL
jgi:hypothetical protein